MADKQAKKNEKIPVMLPRMGATEDQYVLVGINGVLTQIPRGKHVMVTRAVYEQLRRSESAKEVSEAFLTGNNYAKLNI